MKLLLENFRKNMDEKFRGPTDDPSFADPGGSLEYDELSDQVTQMIDDATNGTPVTLPGDRDSVLTYDDFGDGDGQYLLDGEVFANSFQEAEDQLMQMLDQRFNENTNSGEQEMNLQEVLKEKIKKKILENLGAGETGMAQKRLKGAAGAAQKKLENPAVDRAIGMATKRLQQAPPQQKVDFLLSMAQKIGIEPDELQGLMSRLKGSAKKAADTAEDEAVTESSLDERQRRMLNKSQISMLMQTMRQNGVDLPDFKPGDPSFNALLTYLMKGDVKGAVEVVKKVAPNADHGEIQMSLYAFT